MAVAGALIGAVSGIASGIMGMQQAKYQAQVANMNAKIAKDNADRATIRGGVEAEDNDFETRALLAEQEIAQAGSGVSLKGKSQMQTRESAKRLGRRDSLNILQAASIERYNYMVERANFKAEAAAHKQSATFSLIGGALSALGSLAGAVGGGGFSGGGVSSTTGSRVVQPVRKPSLLKTYLNPLGKTKPSYGLLGPI